MRYSFLGVPCANFCCPIRKGFGAKEKAVFRVLADRQKFAWVGLSRLRVRCGNSGLRLQSASTASGKHPVRCATQLLLPLVAPSYPSLGLVNKFVLVNILVFKV